MSEINDGGPAFPSHTETQSNQYGNGQQHFGYSGMSLRAWLAGQVVGVTAYSLPPEQAANEAVEIADALIKRLEQP